MITKETIALAKKLWDYHLMHHQLAKADCILVLGSHDTRIAKRGAELYLAGWARWLVFSGGLGNLTRNIWQEPEADKFARIAVQMGVPKKNIFIENKSTNTGENIRFSYQLLRTKNILPKRIIIVQKPYMERRAYATFRKQWPGLRLKVMVTSPQIPFEQYPHKQISQKDVINIMVGDLQRLKIYPKKGFQIRQKIPNDVWQAYEKLVKLGYNGYLIKE